MDKNRIKTKEPSEAHPLSRSNEEIFERHEKAVLEFKEGKSIPHEELEKKIREGIDSGIAEGFDPHAHLQQLKKSIRK